MSIPIVAIVGRPNVGKSSVFNWLVGRRVSIVDPTAGVTRDRISEIVRTDRALFELTDTGGIGIVDERKLAADVEKQIRQAIDEAAVIVYTVDARDGVMALDQDVADRLRLVSKPVILAVNKCDTSEIRLAASDFHRLGYSPVIPVSAQQRLNRTDLLQAIEDALPKGEFSARDVDLKVAIVGKRNVGKSTFVNAIAQAERVIVSEIPGTTRDSVDVRFERDGKQFTIIDTAGLKHKNSLSNSIEFYSQVRAEESIRRSDVVLHFFDSQMPISRLDKQLAGYIVEHAKPAIFVVNKWDLAVDLTSTEEFGKYVAKMFPMLDYVPIAFTTAKDGKNVFKVWNLAQNLAKQAAGRLGTGELNRLIDIALTKNPAPQRNNKLPKVYYATQASASPPTIVMMTNGENLFEEHYLRYLLRFLRENSPFQEVPIKLEFRAKKNAKAQERTLGEMEGALENTKLKKPTAPPKPRVKKPKPKKEGTWKI